ncbi:hypothetical protein [Microbacterium sp. SORGH_AS_0888]|uniref:hypothetical protein n=1 Tax=Microbacterium sp. SORGH_AS_0888 TaxID=3041791 RepID=UPI002784D259|nr:hypothetical protein [Microbacterium sp. SORGH_AS_0888]MDQ1128678.1 large-conductance mechanosensitive channel [Microbacterium sp. SORGH_AS_0888]
MIVATLLAAAAETEHHGNVMLETIGYPIVAAIVFLFLGLVTLSYRHVSNRHPRKSAVYAEKHAKDLQPHGHGH